MELNQIKDTDTVAQIQFLRTFCWLFFVTLFVVFPAMIMFTKIGLLAAIGIGTISSLIISLILVVAIDKLGSFAGMFYSGRRASWTLRETLQVDLDIAKNLKRHKEFQQAIGTVNNIILQDPEWSEALFLKAQILSEGFGNYNAAKGCLKKIIENESDQNSSVYRWASEMHRQLSSR